MKFKNSKDQKTITLYGFHAVREAWLNPDRTFGTLYMTEIAKKGFEQTLHEAKGKGLRRPQPVEIDKRKLEKLVPRDAVHQGLALSCMPLEENDVTDLVIRNQESEHALFLMLDQVTDPHNIGAILRSACVFGASGLVLQKKHSPNFDGVLAKTACGGLEHTPIALETNLSRSLETFKEHGYFIYGLDERGEICMSTLGASKTQGSNDQTHQCAQKSVLILGAEGAGLRRLIRENCDMLVRLPASGPIKSLNVSNAAAVALYAMKNNR